MSLARLARAADIPESTVRRRVTDLGSRGVLMYEVEVDPSLYGRRLDVMCWLGVQPQALAAVTSALAGHTEVAFAATTTGVTSVIAILELADAVGLHNYLTERLGAISGITAIETDVAVRWIKRSGQRLPSR
jgi:DNA-binding Lrp family transcriptional regulator